LGGLFQAPRRAEAPGIEFRAHFPFFSHCKNRPGAALRNIGACHDAEEKARLTAGFEQLFTNGLGFQTGVR